MKLKNKLDITTEKYWMKNEAVAIKGSLAEILELEIYSANKLKYLLSEDIELNAIRLDGYTTGFFAKLKKVLCKTSIEWHTKDLAKKKEQLNELANHNPSELYVINRHNDCYDGFINEIWECRNIDKELFLSKEFLETKFIKSLVEITDKQYIQERQSLADSKVRWKAHSDKIDSEKNSESESGHSLTTMLMMIGFFVIMFYDREIVVERSCTIKDDYVGCQFTIENPNSSTLVKVRNEVKENPKAGCDESKVDDKLVISCKSDFTEIFSTLKSMQSEKLGLSKDLSNTEFVEAIGKFPNSEIDPKIRFIKYNSKATALEKKLQELMK